MAPKQPKVPGKNGTTSHEQLLLQLAQRHLDAGPPAYEDHAETIESTVELLIAHGHLDVAESLLPLFEGPYRRACQRARIAAARGPGAEGLVADAMKDLATYEAGFESLDEYRCRDLGRATAEVALAATRCGHADADALWEKAASFAEKSPTSDSAWGRIARARLDAGDLDAALDAIEADPEKGSGLASVGAELAAAHLRNGDIDAAFAVVDAFAESWNGAPIPELLSYVATDMDLLQQVLDRSELAAADELLRDKRLLGADDYAALRAFVDEKKPVRSGGWAVDDYLAHGELDRVLASVGDDWQKAGERALVALLKGDEAGAVAILDDMSGERAVDAWVKAAATSEDFARNTALPRLEKLAGPPEVDPNDSFAAILGPPDPDERQVYARLGRARVFRTLGDASASDAELASAFAEAGKLKGDHKRQALDMVYQAHQDFGQPLQGFKVRKKLPKSFQESQYTYGPVALDFVQAGDLAGAGLVSEHVKDDRNSVRVLQEVLWTAPVFDALVAAGHSPDHARFRAGFKLVRDAQVLGVPYPRLAPVAGVNPA